MILISIMILILIRICDQALLLEKKRQFLKCVNYVCKILSKDYRNLSARQNPLIIFFPKILLPSLYPFTLITEYFMHLDMPR